MSFQIGFVCKFIWKSKLGKVGTTSTISATHEYILCYSKNVAQSQFKMIENISEGRKESLRQWGVADRREDRPSMYYPITIDGITVYPIKEDGTDGRWRVGEEMAKQLLSEGVLELGEKNGKQYLIYEETYEGMQATTKNTVKISPEIVEDLQKENALRSRYSKLIASAQIPFRGGVYTLSQLSPWKQNADDEIRTEAWTAEGNWYNEHGAELDEIYDELEMLFENEFGTDEEIKAVFDYQRKILKRVGNSGEIIIRSDYDFYDYMANIYEGRYEPLKKTETVITVDDKDNCESLYDYACRVVWYGRNQAMALYSSDCRSPKKSINGEC